MHAPIKELAIRWVEHRSGLHSNEPRHLAEATEVAFLRGHLSFCLTAGTYIPHATSPLQTGGGARRHPTARFTRPDACACTLNRGGKQVRGTGRSQRERGKERKPVRERCDWDRDGGGDGSGNKRTNTRQEREREWRWKRGQRELCNPPYQEKSRKKTGHSIPHAESSLYTVHRS